MRVGFHGRVLLLLLGVAVVTLSACVAGTARATPTANVSPSPTAMPPTPTPVIPERILLWSPSSLDQGWRADVAQSLDEQSRAKGWELRIVSGEWSEESLKGVDLALLLGPLAEVDGLAAAHPETYFVVMGQPGVEPAVNLAVVGSQGMGEDLAAFMAGYLAALVTEDWRVGALLVSGSLPAEALALAFQNGAIYYCGLCRAAYPPFHAYPQTVVLEGADPISVQAGLESLATMAVTTIFLNEAEATFDLAQAPGFMWIVGDDSGDLQTSKVIAAVRPQRSEAIASALQAWENGEEGRFHAVGINIIVLDDQVLTQGRERLAREVLGELMAGAIATGIENSQPSASTP